MVNRFIDRCCFGPIIGGALLEQFSWHSAFLINVPFVIIAVVAGLFLLPESKLSKEKSHSWDIPSTILSIAGMIGLVWSIKRIFKRRTSRYYSMGCNSISNYHDSDIC